MIATQDFSLAKNFMGPSRQFILTTKFHIPHTHPTFVDRPHLIERLNTCWRCQLTLVSAPAGFGKTTLVADWAHKLRNGERTTAYALGWLAIDQDDNDPLTFLTHFILCLQSIESELADTALHWMESTPESLIEAVLAAAINDVAEFPGHIALIFDDFHLLTEPAIHHAFTFLLDNQPGNLHLILISRADPPWPLARLRARQELNEIRPIDLRFSVAETAAFLNGAMQFDLDPEEIKALDNRTEGWIAGLQMAALSLRGRKDITGFVKAFTGSHRFILDYLMEEVLEQQATHIQEFLLKTSILEQMNVPLCDAVLDLQDSQSILRQLEQENIFLIALDDERRWYRYHHLFADLLRERLLQSFPRQKAGLHLRAAGWCAENGLLNAAVRHTFSAGYLDQAAHLIGQNALAMAYRGELQRLISWLNRLPAESVQTNPQLCIAYAWALGFSGHLHEGESWLQKAEVAAATSADNKEQHQNGKHHQLTGHIAAARAYFAGFGDDIPQISRMARKALAGLPEKEFMTRALAAAILGIGLRRAGDFRGAGAAFEEAVALSEAAGDEHLLVDMLWERSVLEFIQGKLNKVMETCQTARRLAEDYKNRSGRVLPIVGYIYERMSAVLWEWNDLTGAEHYARKGVRLCQHWGNADAFVNCSFSLARVLLARGELDHAQNALQGVSHQVSGLGTWYRLTAGAIEAQIRLAQGDDTAVARWVESSELTAKDELLPEHHSLYTILARHLIAENQTHEALELLDRLLTITAATGGTRLVIGVLILRATVLPTASERTAALEQALALAEPEGFVRSFVVEGEPVYALLKQAAARGSTRNYARKLLAAFPDQGPKQQPQMTASPSTLIEPLSKRELDVLRLLKTHLSSTEIAAELIIAPSTVRSHIKNIYSKLNVHSRHEAVIRAEALHLY